MPPAPRQRRASASAPPRPSRSSIRAGGEAGARDQGGDVGRHRARRAASAAAREVPRRGMRPQRRIAELRRPGSAAARRRCHRRAREVDRADHPERQVDALGHRDPDAHHDTTVGQRIDRRARRSPGEQVEQRDADAPSAAVITTPVKPAAAAQCTGQGEHRQHREIARDQRACGTPCAPARASRANPARGSLARRQQTRQARDRLVLIFGHRYGSCRAALA